MATGLDSHNGCGAGLGDQLVCKAQPGRRLGPALPLLNWINVSAVIIALIIMLPISEQTRGQVLEPAGVVLTAVIALSSTTFVSNAMAGVMLQATQPFRPGTTSV